MIKRIQGQPAEPTQPSHPLSKAEPKTGPHEASNTNMMKNANAVQQMHTKGRFILGAGEPASYDKNVKNASEAKLAEKVFNRSIGG